MKAIFLPKANSGSKRRRNQDDQYYAQWCNEAVVFYTREANVQFLKRHRIFRHLVSISINLIRKLKFFLIIVQLNSKETIHEAFPWRVPHRFRRLLVLTYCCWTSSTRPVCWAQHWPEHHVVYDHTIAPFLGQEHYWYCKIPGNIDIT